MTSLLIEDRSNRQIADLRCELLESDVEAVELKPAGRPPPATTAVNLVVLDAPVVTSARSKQLLAVVAALGSWLARFYERRMHRERDGASLEPTGSKEKHRLTDDRLCRHAGR